MSSDELEMDLDELMEQLARFTLEEKFAAGGNAFEKRFESMERQVALLIAYTDVLELQQTVDETTLDMVASILRWIFEHYSNEVDTKNVARRRHCQFISNVIRERWCVTEFV